MTSKTAYVVASNQDKEEARNVMASLSKKGYEVHDWTKRVKNVSLKQKTMEDFLTLKKSDIVIVINPQRLTPGKYTEIGACLALEKTVYFLNHAMLGVFGIVTSDAIITDMDEIDRR